MSGFLEYGLSNSVASLPGRDHSRSRFVETSTGGPKECEKPARAFDHCVVAPLSTGQLLIVRSAIYIYLKLEFGSRGNVNVAHSYGDGRARHHYISRCG